MKKFGNWMRSKNRDLIESIAYEKLSEEAHKVGTGRTFSEFRLNPYPRPSIRYSNGGNYRYFVKDIEVKSEDFYRLKNLFDEWIGISSFGLPEGFRYYKQLEDGTLQ
jgi:hypothetical protein